MGQSVEGVGGQQQAVEQQGVGGDGGIAQAGALHRDQEEHQLQRQRAQENVAVDRHQRAPACPLPQRTGVESAGITRQRLASKDQAKQRAAPFGDHRGARGPGHAPVEAEHEPQVQRDIDEVGRQQNGQRRAGVLRAEKPADQRIAGQRGGQAEQARVEIVAGQVVQFRGGLHQLQRGALERHAERAQQQGEAEGQQQPLQQYLAQRAAIVAASGLGGETGRAHAQEAHHPHQQRVQAAANRHRAQLVSVRQMADHAAVHQRHQRHGQVRQDHRRRQSPHLLMRGRVAPGGKHAGHYGPPGQPGTIRGLWEKRKNRRPRLAPGGALVQSVNQPAQQPQAEEQPDQSADDRAAEE